MRVRNAGLVVLLLALSAVPATAAPFTIGFTAGDVTEVMAERYGDPLSSASSVWGLWSIRAAPVVEGGGYDIVGGSVDDGVPGDFWAYAAPSASVAWAEPYGTEVASWYQRPASEHLDTAAHPVYFIADQPASAFQSYAFDNTLDNGFRRSSYLGVCGVDVAAGDPRCNQANVLPGSARFSFSFLLDPGATLLGWQFLVDGSQYYRAGSEPADWASTSRWVQDFIGGDALLPYEPYHQTVAGGGLAHNVGAGYFVPVPEPGTLALLVTGLAGAVAAARSRRRR